MPLNVTVGELANRTYKIVADGSIDASTYTILKAELETVLKKSPTLIIFDMKDVSFVSSAGISVVLMAEQSLKQSGGKTLMVNVQPQIRRVFDIVQVLPPQQIFRNVEEMDEYLAIIQRKVKDGEIK